MLKSLLTLGAAAACFALPATAESYTRGDGCGGTYIDRKSEMMAGNITGGTRYKCTPFQKLAKPEPPKRLSSAAPRTTTQTYSTETYAAPQASTQTYTQTYSVPSQTHTTTTPTYAPSTTYSSGSPAYSYDYGKPTVTQRAPTAPEGSTNYYEPPKNTYQSGTATTQPAATRQSGESYGTAASRAGNSATPYTTSPRRTNKNGIPLSDETSNSTLGTPRVSGNLANGYTTTDPIEPDKPKFNLGQPETFMGAGDK